MQTRWQSMVEAFLNTLTGYIISVVAQVLIFPHYGVHLGLGENMQIVAIFTAISIVVLFVVTYFPDLILFLPRYFKLI